MDTILGMVAQRDLHHALRTEQIGSTVASGLHMTLMRMQSSRTDIAFSLHMRPSEFSTAGFQWTDFLSHLGFGRTGCPHHHGDGYCRFVDEGLDLNAFGQALRAAYQKMQEADRHFEACGFWLPRPEGFGYFFGKPSSETRPSVRQNHGNGHTSSKNERQKVCEDANFEFVLSWIESGQGHGWTTHYRPKSGHVSEEVQAVFDIIGISRFQECPEFDFDPCHWHFTPFEARETFFGMGNAESAHRWFDGLAGNFSSAIEQFLAAEALLEPFGFTLLSLQEAPKQRQSLSIGRKILKSKVTSRSPLDGELFDVAISFAGTNRTEAERLATLVQNAGFSVFYDGFYGSDLWGKNLAEFFDEIYRKRSRYCVMFISENYRDRAWTIHERRSAQARALEEKGAEYILPIRVDDVELPGMAPTIGYVSLREYGIDEIAQMLIQKLEKRA